MEVWEKKHVKKKKRKKWLVGGFLGAWEKKGTGPLELKGW